MRWRPHEVRDCFGYVDFTALMASPPLQPVRDAVAYAACSVWSPDGRTVWAELAGEEQLKLWVQRSVGAGGGSPRVVVPRRVAVTLHTGWNEVLIKATRGPQEEFSGRMFGFYFRFVDRAWGGSERSAL